MASKEEQGEKGSFPSLALSGNILTAQHRADTSQTPQRTLCYSNDGLTVSLE
jgi:hypothetical protein